MIPEDQKEIQKELSERIAKIKNDILMQEPCPIYEADEDDWDDFWYGPDVTDDPLDTWSGAWQGSENRVL